MSEMAKKNQKLQLSQFVDDIPRSPLKNQMHDDSDDLDEHFQALEQQDKPKADFALSTKQIEEKVSVEEIPEQVDMDDLQDLKDL